MQKITEEYLDSRIALVTKEAAGELTFLRAYKVETSDHYRATAEQIGKLKTELDSIETERRSFTDPLNEVIKRINGKVKPASTFLDTAIRLLKSAMGAFEMREDERQREALERAAALARQGDVAAASLALARVDSETPTVAGYSSVESWDFEIEDVNKIPREFMEPNEKAIRAFVKASKKENAIPGVRSFKIKIGKSKGAA